MCSLAIRGTQLNCCKISKFLHWLTSSKTNFWTFLLNIRILSSYLDRYDYLDLPLLWPRFCETYAERKGAHLLQWLLVVDLRPTAYGLPYSSLPYSSRQIYRRKGFPAAPSWILTSNRVGLRVLLRSIRGSSLVVPWQPRIRGRRIFIFFIKNSYI